MSNKSRRIIFTSVSVGGSTIFALILAEILLRLAGFEYRLLPTKVQFGWPDPITIKQAYQVDKDLLWVPKDYHVKVSFGFEKHPAIVFMGCSVTEFGRYDQFLKSLIDEHQTGIHNFTIVNVGVGGWSSFQGLQQLKRDILPMKPSIVTILYGWNDHWSTFGIEDKDIGNFNLAQPDWLLNISKSRVVQLINRTILSVKYPINDRNKGRLRVSLSDFSSNLDQMVKLARENSITPVLLTAPSSHKKGYEPAYLSKRWLDDLNELIPLHQKYVQAVRDIASKEHVLLIDLYAEFNQFNQEDLNKFFLKDGIHLTSEGNRKIAEMIYKQFVLNGLINSEGSND